MVVNLNEAAKAYGLQSVPSVAFDNEPGEHAGFGDDHMIHVSPDLVESIDDYDESRFENAGAGHLSQEDGARFVIAHELWHAKQYEDDPGGLMADTLRYKLGIEDHDDSPYEQAADQHAATAYKLIGLED